MPTRFVARPRWATSSFRRRRRSPHSARPRALASGTAPFGTRVAAGPGFASFWRVGASPRGSFQAARSGRVGRRAEARRGRVGAPRKRDGDASAPRGTDRGAKAPGFWGRATRRTTTPRRSGRRATDRRASARRVARPQNLGRFRATVGSAGRRRVPVAPPLDARRVPVAPPLDARRVPVAPPLDARRRPRRASARRTPRPRRASARRTPRPRRASARRTIAKTYETRTWPIVGPLYKNTPRSLSETQAYAGWTRAPHGLRRAGTGRHACPHKPSPGWCREGVQPVVTNGRVVSGAGSQPVTTGRAVVSGVRHHPT